MHRPAPPFRICATKNLWSSLVIVAQKRNLFADAGLNVCIEFTESAKMSMDRLLAGEVHLSTVVPIDLATMAMGQEADCRVVATICVAANNAIVANRLVGIRNASDLKGKRLGVFAGTSSSTFAERIIRQHGLGSNEVHLIPLGRQGMETALLKEEVDAISVWQPLTSHIVAGLNDDHTTVIVDPEYRGFMTLCVRGDRQVTYNDALPPFLRALREAEGFTRNQPATAQQIVADQIDMNLEMVADLWDNFDMHLHLDAAQLECAIAEETNAISEGFGTPNIVFDPLPLKRSVSDNLDEFLN